MKILQVNVVYQKGSTGKITYDLHHSLLDCGFESVVCYGRGKIILEHNVYKICSEWYAKLNNALSRITGIMYGGCLLSTSKLISIIQKEKPDVVHLQCINGYFVNIYRLVKWLKVNNIKTVLTLHAEFMHTANCGHALDCEKWKTGCGNCPRRRAETLSLIIDGTARSWIKMRDAFDGFDKLIVASVSPWLMNRAMQSPILSGKEHMVVFNGVNTDVFKPSETKKGGTQVANNAKKIVFHATPSFSSDRNHSKGGWYICELAKKMPEVQFIVAGKFEEKMEVPLNVKLLGEVRDQCKMAELYSSADVTVITSRRETFSMVAAESLCCDTPVVGFFAGGPEEIALPNYSDFSEYGNIEMLEENIRKWMQHKKDGLCAQQAKQTYGKNLMLKTYVQIYEHLIAR